MTSLQLAKECARLADSKKGEDIVIMDVQKISSITDFFVLVSAQADPHLKAIRNEIEVKLKEEGVKAQRIDGFPRSQWVVMDYTDVVVHVFDRNTREFYGLERLWGDAQRIEWS